MLDALNARWSEVPLRSGSTTRSPDERGLSVDVNASSDTEPTLGAPGRPESPPLARLTPAELDRRLTERRHRRDDFILLDVREPEEYMRSSIPGSRLVPLARTLTEAGRAEIGETPEVIAYCALGPRAEQAATDLAAHGYAVTVLEGGIAAWESR